MTEAFEEGDDTGQAGVDGVHAGEDGVEFVGDAFLLVPRCER